LPSQRPIPGRRGYGLARHNFWGESKPSYPIIIAQIETAIAVDTFFGWGKGDGDDYSRILGELNYLLIGPYDLSSSLGCAGNFDSEYFKQYMNNIKKNVPSRILGYHIVKDIEKQYFDLKDCGFLAFGLDTLMLIDGIKSMQSIAIPKEKIN
jgi:2-keto-3-deoxy-L-rhamnonate aldolase RhmA